MIIEWGSLALGLCCGGVIVAGALFALLFWWLRDYRPMGY